jgi:hypothetical protein
MREQEVFVLADEALCDVVDGIGDDQWAMGLPPWFRVSPTQKDLDLRRIVNYHAYDDAWVPDVLAGRTVGEVGDAHDGDLLGADPKASFRAIAERAIEAVRALSDGDAPVHLSYGDWPAREYLQHITCFRGFRVHELSKLIGISPTLPDALVDGLMDVVAPHAEEWRQLGVFGPALPVEAGADPRTTLLCLAGYEP